MGTCSCYRAEGVSFCLQRRGEECRQRVHGWILSLHRPSWQAAQRPRRAAAPATCVVLHASEWLVPTDGGSVASTVAVQHRIHRSTPRRTGFTAAYALMTDGEWQVALCRAPACRLRRNKYKTWLESRKAV